MAKQLRVAKYDDAVAALLERAQQLDVYVIGRIQDSAGRGFSVNNGRLEGVSTGSSVGIGVQVFTKEGHTGFVCSDKVTPETVRNLVETAAKLARSAAQFGTETNRAVFDVSSNGVQTIATDFKRLDETSYEDQVRELMEVNSRTRGLNDKMAVRSSHSVSDPHWRIVRSDGTDISFDTPHASAATGMTLAGSGAVAATTVGAGVSGPDAGVLLDSTYQEKLELRIRKSAELVAKLVDAPQIKGGNYKLVVDYALAKGLAHEAFGHASETDGMETSILGNAGKMRIGEEMAASFVTITDGPVLGDYAYQPVSANGMLRQTVEILKDGVLRAGLADLFSAGQAGVPITGAERIETYRSLPIPRMTNIRISVKEPLPFETRFEEVTPEELRAKLLEYNLISEGEQALYLSGYRGGQVNPKDGDFVFNCAAIYDLSTSVPQLYQPAIFSGKVLSALRSILAGLGPMYIDAQGTCGKGGQSVPSSGGAHAFIVIDKNPNVFIGGA